MDYLIISNPPYTNTVKIGLKLSPENEPLKFFLSGTKLNRFPELLESTMLSDGFVNEVSQFRPYDVMDWEDIRDAKGIQIDEVEIYHQVFGSTIINKRLFAQILLDYSIHLLAAYRYSDQVPQEWINAMEGGIKTLRQKIENQA